MLQLIIQIVIKKYLTHVILIGLIVILSLGSYLFQSFQKKEEPVQIKSLDSLVPKGFVLMPIEIVNRQDIMNIITSFGVVDLYSYSKQTELPTVQVAKSVKVIAPKLEDSSFVILVPEQKVSLLFEHSPPFYAVIQNPEKKDTKIYKKYKKKSLVIIEEGI